MRRDVFDAFPAEECDRIIEGLGLHNSYPVWVPPLYDFLNIRIYTDVRLPDGHDAFSAKRAGFAAGIAVFDPRLTYQEFKRALFHEMGHLLQHESGKPHTCMRNGKITRHELEAELVGAYLAAPGWAVYELFKEGFNASEVASILEVTPEMLQLRCELMSYRNEFGIQSNPIQITGWF